MEFLHVKSGAVSTLQQGPRSHSRAHWMAMRGTWPSSGLCLWVLSVAFMTHMHCPPSDPRPPEFLMGLFSCQCTNVPAAGTTRSSCNICPSTLLFGAHICPRSLPGAHSSSPYNPGPVLPWQG